MNFDDLCDLDEMLIQAWPDTCIVTDIPRVQAKKKKTSKMSSKLEARRIHKFVGHFKRENSIPWQHMDTMYPGSTFAERVSIAKIINYAAPAVPLLPRPAKRSCDALAKWFHENWDLIYPILLKISLCDASGEVIRTSTK